jgi:hypothetical protein
MGIFRLSGSKNKQRDFYSDFNLGYKYEPLLQGKASLDDADFYHTIFPKKTDVHMVTGLLKQYLRELPEPILADQTKSFIKVGESIPNTTNTTEVANQLKGLIKALPDINQLVLWHVIALAAKVASPTHIDKTKMVCW